MNPAWVSATHPDHATESARRTFWRTVEGQAGAMVIGVCGHAAVAGRAFLDAAGAPAAECKLEVIHQLTPPLKEP